MTELSLTELLDSVGLSKKQLADLLDVSISTINRMGDQVEDYVLEAVELYQLNNKPIKADEVPVARTRHKPMTECTEDEIRAIWRRRGTGGESDYEIAHSMGMRVFQFRHEFIDQAVARFS